MQSQVVITGAGNIKPPTEDFKKGIITIVIISADLARSNIKLFGKMNPYCNISYGGNSYQTKTCKGGDKTPVWNHKFKIDVANPKEEILVGVWNENLSAYDQLGYATMKMYSLMFNDGIEDTFPLYHNNKIIGNVKLMTQFIAEGDDGYSGDLAEYKIG